MSDLRDAVLTRKKREQGLEASRDVTKAELIKVDGSVKVTGRTGYVWAREYGQHGGVFQVFNPKVSAWAGLPVLVAIDPKRPARRQVTGVDWDTIGALATYDGNPYLPQHGPTHVRYDGYYGPDPVDVYGRMLFPLRCESGTGLTVQVMPLVYQVGGTRVYYAGVDDLDVSSHVPGTSGKARQVLVYLDTADNEAKASPGALGSSAAGVALSYPSIPAGGIPSAYVRLAYGDTALAELSDFEDARMLFAALQSAIGQTMNTIPVCGA